MEKIKTGILAIKKNIIQQMNKMVVSNFFLLFNRIFEQIIFLPFLLHIWGDAIFIEYIKIFSLAYFFNFIGSGYYSYFSNKLAIDYRSKSKKVINIFFTNYSRFFLKNIFLLNVFFLFVFILIIENNFFKISSLSHIEMILVFIFSMISSIVSQQSLSLFSGFRFIQKSHIAFNISGIISLITFLIIYILIFLFKMSPIYMALIITLKHLVIYIILHILLKSKNFNSTIQIFKKNNFSIKNKLKEINGFFQRDFSNYLIQDFLIILITSVLSVELTAIILFHRISSRFINLITSIFSIPLKNQSGLLYKTKSLYILRDYTNKGIKIMLFISLLYSLFFYYFGGFIFQIWTDNYIEFSFTLFILIFISSVLELLWTFISSISFGTNNHNLLSKFYFIFTIFTIVIFYLLLRFVNIEYALTSIIFLETIILFISFKNFKAITKTKI